MAASPCAHLSPPAALAQLRRYRKAPLYLMHNLPLVCGPLLEPKVYARCTGCQRARIFNIPMAEQ